MIRRWINVTRKLARSLHMENREDNIPTWYIYIVQSIDMRLKLRWKNFRNQICTFPQDENQHLD